MTLCPKCRHVRAVDATTSIDECPACGVIYEKAAQALRRVDPAPTVIHYQAANRFDESGLPWRKLALFAAVVCIAWSVFKTDRPRRPGSEFAKSWSSEQISALAAGVKPGEVVMYSTTYCGYCTQAAHWLDHHGFAFTECNMSNSRRCEDEFRAHGGRGTPYLVIQRHGKTYKMQSGFDSDEFFAALSQSGM